MGDERSGSLTRRRVHKGIIGSLTRRRDYKGTMGSLTLPIVVNQRQTPQNECHMQIVSAHFQFLI